MDTPIVRTIIVNYKRTLKSGEVVIGPRRKTYTVKSIPTKITDELHEKIMHLHSLGVPKTVIAKQIGISAFRVTSEIKRTLSAENETTPQ